MVSNLVICLGCTKCGFFGWQSSNCVWISWQDDQTMEYFGWMQIHHSRWWSFWLGNSYIFNVIRINGRITAWLLYVSGLYNIYDHDVLLFRCLAYDFHLIILTPSLFRLAGIAWLKYGIWLIAVWRSTTLDIPAIWIQLLYLLMAVYAPVVEKIARQCSGTWMTANIYIPWTIMISQLVCASLQIGKTCHCIVL